MVKLGNYIQGNMAIQSGDAYIVQRVLTAGEKPVLIQAGSFWGGDAGEYLTLAILPPNVTGIGAKPISHYVEQGNAQVIFNGNIVGGYSADEAQSLFGAYTRQQMGTAFYLPPHYTLVAYPQTANSAIWNISVGGFECEDY